MKMLIYGVALGVLLKLSADNYHLLFMPEPIVPLEVMEQLEASDYEEIEPEEVWLVLPKWRPA